MSGPDPGQAEERRLRALFFASIAHELNNPVAFVMANLSAIDAQLAAIGETLETVRLRLRDEIGEHAARVFDEVVAPRRTYLGILDAQVAAAENLAGLERIRAIVQEFVERGPAAPEVDPLADAAAEPSNGDGFSRRGSEDAVAEAVGVEFGMGPALAAPRHPGSVARRRRRVLVVDDEELLLRAYPRMLGPEYEVVAAHDGDEALKHLARDPDVDAIVCDLMMPGMDGPTFQQRLCAGWPMLRHKLVFATGGAFTPGTEAFLRATSNPVLHKPYTTAELRALLDRVMKDALS